MLNHAPRRVRVLYIEDSPADARYVQELVVAAGGQDLDFHWCATLSDGLTCLNLGANVDIVLLDLQLPDARGMQAVSRILESYPEMPILVLTGLDTEATGLEALKLGAQDFLLKRELTGRSVVRCIRYCIERKLAEDNVKRLSLMEDREDFTATLTHDLRNPLLGFDRVFELFADGTLGPLTDEQKKIMERLRSSNKMVLDMIDRLLEVYSYDRGQEAVQFEETDLPSLIEQCVEDITPLAEGRQIRLRAELPEAQAPIQADALSIRRVVQNLLGNAIKFTPPGGLVTLRLRDGNQEAVLEVEDNGPGIAEEDRQLLFQRFWRGGVKRRYSSGTGLGLFLCKKIVEIHGGQIAYVDSQRGGATFRVVLPYRSKATTHDAEPVG